MNSNSIIPFEFEGNNFNIYSDENGKLLFAASEVCGYLGLKNVSKTLDTLDADEKQKVTKGYETSGRQGIWAVTESGLYHLIFKSRKDSAVKFRRWVTEEVLPSIRKNAGYISPNATLDQIRELQSQLNKAQQQIADLQQVTYWLGVKQGSGKFLADSLPNGDRD